MLQPEEAEVKYRNTLQVLPFGSASHAAGIDILAFRGEATPSRPIKSSYDFITWSSGPGFFTNWHKLVGGGLTTPSENAL